MAKNGFPPDFIEKVKEKNDIISVLSQKLTVQRKGRNYWACCPFHYEKEPSFVVNQDEQYYHCFGCGESGDVISFLQKYDNLTFFEAVKTLADAAGLELPEYQENLEEKEKYKKKEKVLKALNLAKDYYISNLHKNADVEKYLSERKLNLDVENAFNLGYSPDWTGLITFLKQNNIDEKTMHEAGLIEYSERNTPYDVFQKRLTFPILNAFGDTIGFTARTMEKESNFAKYRNSTQTIVFDKSKTVYNIYSLKELKKVAPLNCAIICEGTMDVIAMYKAGIKNAVCCMGTAITSEHAKEIKKYTSKVKLCLDGDSAGQNASFKAIDVLDEVGLEVGVVKLKENLDPDEFLNKYGAEELKNALDNTLDKVEFKIEFLKNKYNLESNVEKAKFVKESIDVIDKLKTHAEKEIYLKILSQKSNIAVDALRKDLTKNVYVEKHLEETEKPLITREVKDVKITKFVLSSMLYKKDYAMNNFPMDLTFKNSNYQNLYDYLKNCKISNEKYTISNIFDRFDVENNKDIEALINFNFDEFGENLKEYYEKCLKSIDLKKLLLLQEQLKNEYAKEVDLSKRKEIVIKLNDLAKKIKLENNNV